MRNSLFSKIDFGVYMKINLGCGHFPKEGYLNVDNAKNPGVDLSWDLENIPYPFDSNSANEIYAEHVLEHLNSPIDVVKECHRILKSNGRLIIKVPHFTRGFTCADHKRGFDVTFAYEFLPVYKEYSGITFSVEKARLRWFADRPLKREVISRPVFILVSSIGKIIDFVANLSPFLCSRIWAYWVGGFDEVEFIFKKL